MGCSLQHFLVQKSDPHFNYANKEILDSASITALFILVVCQCSQLQKVFKDPCQICQAYVRANPETENKNKFFEGHNILFNGHYVVLLTLLSMTSCLFKTF